MQFPITPLTILFAALTGFLGAYLAKRRGRNPYLWFFMGSFFGILGAFAIFFAPSKKKPVRQPVEAAAAPELPPSIQGPSDKFWYYLDPSHQQVGPMSHDALTAAWSQGKISLTTYVWHEELPDWKPLQELITSSP